MSNKNKRNELHEKQLESLAKQLEGKLTAGCRKGGSGCPYLLPM